MYMLAMSAARRKPLAHILKVTTVLTLSLISLQSCNKDEPEPEPVVQTPTYMESITDIDGNIYHTVKIGNQVWTVENLKTTHYRNGDEIPEVSDYGAWSDLTTGGRSSYSNNAANGEVYGFIYNWYVVNDSRGLAPDGWRVPTPTDYHILDSYLNGACGGLKQTGTTYWVSPNAGATNVTGFAALGGGERGTLGWYEYLNYRLALWTSGEVNDNTAERATLYSNNEQMGFYTYNKKCGFSVRLIKE